MLSSMEETLDLVGRFQDAALDPERWLDAFRVLAESFDSEVGGLTLGAADRSMLLFNILASDITPIPDLERKQEQYVMSDLRLSYGMAHPGEAFACRQVLDSATWEATPFYQNLIVPHGLAYTMVCVDIVDRHYLYGGSTMRSPERGPYTTEEVAQFSQLTPHLVRAVRTQIRLGMQNGVSADLRAALDRLGVAVILVDHEPRVWFANQAAEAILRAQDGLSQSNGILRASDPASSARLEALVAETVKAARCQTLARGDAMNVERPSGRSPLSVLCVPLRADRLNAFPLRPTAMLFVSDPEAERPVPEALISRLFGLTAAEARLCGDLLRGLDLAAHAAQHAIAVSTAKSHLKAIFAKTGTGRQIDLLRLILTSPVGHAVLEGISPA